MTAVRIADSLKYGAVMFGYFLVIAVVGLGGMVLGGALALPELQSVIDDNSVAAAELGGGAVLGFLGVAVWTGGLFALTYKLVADAVASGQTDITVTLSEQGEVTDSTATRTVRPEPESTDQSSAADERTSQQQTSRGAENESATVAGTAGGRRSTDEPEGERGWSGNWGQQESEAATVEEADSQQEQTAEEIAFGDDPGRTEATGEAVEASASDGANGESAVNGDTSENTVEASTTDNVVDEAARKPDADTERDSETVWEQSETEPAVTDSEPVGEDVEGMAEGASETGSDPDENDASASEQSGSGTDPLGDRGGR